MIRFGRHPHTEDNIFLTFNSPCMHMVNIEIEYNVSIVNVVVLQLPVPCNCALKSKAASQLVT